MKDSEIRLIIQAVNTLYVTSIADLRTVLLADKQVRDRAVSIAATIQQIEQDRVGKLVWNGGQA